MKRESEYDADTEKINGQTKTNIFDMLALFIYYFEFCLCSSTLNSFVMLTGIKRDRMRF